MGIIDTGRNKLCSLHKRGLEVRDEPFPGICGFKDMALCFSSILFSSRYSLYTNTLTKRLVRSNFKRAAMVNLLLNGSLSRSSIFCFRTVCRDVWTSKRSPFTSLPSPRRIQLYKARSMGTTILCTYLPVDFSCSNVEETSTKSSSLAKKMRGCYLLVLQLFTVEVVVGVKSGVSLPISS